MLQTLEAVLDNRGFLQFLEPVNLTQVHRVLVTLLKEEPAIQTMDFQNDDNPLSNSIIFESDIVSPLDLTWQVEQ